MAYFQFYRTLKEFHLPNTTDYMNRLGLRDADFNSPFPWRSVETVLISHINLYRRMIHVPIHRMYSTWKASVII
jgi:hypothetical protein